jgi:hypothetical protein
MDTLTRRQVLGILAAPLTAPLFQACGTDRLLSPLLSLDETTTGPVTLIGAGDPHAVNLVNNTHKAGAMVKAVLDADPNAWGFAIGDLVNNGLEEEYPYYDRAWGAFKPRTLFAIGNHDRKADPSAAAYYDYVGDLGGPRGKGYYAKTLGAWRCYFLNSEQARSEQAAWLAADLPNWSNHHIMAMWHTPMFASTCVHNGGKSMAWPGPKGMGPWWQLLQDHGAEFVVCGHVHRWERFPRMLHDGSVSSRGIRQFIAGTGGVKPMPIFTRHPRGQRQVVTRGVARFDLHPDRYEWRFTDLAGVVQDQGSQTCRIRTQSLARA